jgi:hypothetical protein
MERIEFLLEKLDSKIPSSLADRLDSLDELNDKIEAVGEEYRQNKNDENRKKYNEIIEHSKKMELGIVRDLEALLEKRKSDELPKTQPVTQPATQSVSEPTKDPLQTESREEKKEGFGVLTLVIGGALLIASFGAINYFRKQ